MAKPVKVRRTVKSGKSKTKAASSLPLIVFGVAVLVVLVIVACFVPSMLRGSARSSALARIGAAVDGAATNSDFAQGAKQIEPDLAYLCEFVRNEPAAERQQALAGILPLIPADKFPDACFDIPQASAMFAAVVPIAATRPREWLIEQSCQPSADLRRVAAEALVRQLPGGTAPEAMIAKLAEPLTAIEKQQDWQRAFDEQHLELERTLAGEWSLKVSAEYRDDDGATPEDFDLPGNHLSVSCEQHQWTVKFFDQSWTGRFDELPKLSLTASAQAVAPALVRAPRRATLTTSQLVLTLAFVPQSGFTVQAGGVPSSRPDSAWNVAEVKGNVIRIQNQEITLRAPPTPAGATFSTFDIKEKRDTAFGRIELEASGSGGEVSVAKWRIKGESGYSRFDVTVASQAAEQQVAEQKAADLGLAGRHEGFVLAVAVSPNGELCATSGADRRVMVWDVATRARRHDFGPVEQGVLDLAWSADGKQIVCGLDKGQVAVVSVPGGEIKTIPVRGLQQAIAVAFHPNGREVFCAGHEGVIHQVRIDNGEVVREWNAHTEQIQQVVISADGKLLVSSSHDGTLLCWDIAAGEARQRLIGHSDAIDAHDVSADGTQVVSLQQDGELRRWDVATGQTLERTPTEYRLAQAVWFLPDANRVVIATATKAIGIFDSREGKVIHRQVALHDHVLTNAAITRQNPPQVISGGFDRQVLFAKLPELPLANEARPNPPNDSRIRPWREWKTNLANATWSVTPQANFVLATARSMALRFDLKNPKPDLKILERPTVRGWNAETGQLKSLGEDTPLSGAALFAASANGQRVVTAETMRSGSGGIRVQVWECDANGKLSKPRPLEFPFRDVLLAASEQAQLGASQLSSLIGNNERRYSARSIAVSPTGLWAMVANGQGAVCFYDLQDARLVDQFLLVIDREGGVLNEKYRSPLSHQPAFLSDEELVCGGYVINTRNRRHYTEMRMAPLLTEVSGGDDPSLAVAIVPGQRKLFFAKGREVRGVRVPVFPSPNAAPTATIPPGAPGAPGAPGGRDVRSVPQRPAPTKKATKATGPVKTPELPLRTFRHDEPVVSLVVSSDGTQLATGDEKGQLHLWSLTDGKLLKAVPLDSSPLRHLEFLNADERLASLHADGTIRVWNLDELENHASNSFRLETVLAELPIGSRGGIHPLSDNQRLILSAGSRGWLFDLEKAVVTDRELLLPEVWTTDLKYGLQAIRSARVELLDLKAKREIGRLWPKNKISSEDGDESRAAAFLPNGRGVVVVRKGGKIETWKVPAATVDATNSDVETEPTLHSISSDGNTLLVFHRDGVLRRLDSRTLKEQNRIAIPKSIDVVSRLSLSPDGSLAAISAYFHVAVLKSDTGEVVHEIPQHHFAEFTPDGKRLVTAVNSASTKPGPTLRIHNVSDWSVVAETKSVSRVNGIAITPNGRWLFVIDDNGLLKGALPE